MAKSSTEKALDYIKARELESENGNERIKGPCITVSRESGAGSGLVDDRLKIFLETHQIKEAPKWIIFDKNLIEKTLEDHNLPMRLAKLLTQEKQSAITNMVNELIGLQPSLRTLYRKTAKTVLELAEVGNVIIVGRGGNFITSKLDNVFHVRLVSPLENRVKRIQEYYSLRRKEALDWIKKEDQAREEFTQKNFFKSIEDPLNYHLIINTGLMSYEEAAHVIGKAVMEKFPEMFITAGEIKAIHFD